MADRCETCRWWGRFSAGESSLIIAGGTPSKWQGWGVCEQAGSAQGAAMTSDTQAVALDYESYGAGLVTRPDFGCVQWEAKG